MALRTMKTQRLSRNGKATKDISKYSQDITAVSSGRNFTKYNLSYDVASESEITPCNKIDLFTGKVMTSITTLRTY